MKENVTPAYRSVLKANFELPSALLESRKERA